MAAPMDGEDTGAVRSIARAPDGTPSGRIAAMRSRHPRVLRLLMSLGAVTLGVIALPQVALAQVSINPTESPTRDTGGWGYWMAEGAIVLGAIILLLAGFAYLRFSPRFSREEEAEEG